MIISERGVKGKNRGNPIRIIVVTAIYFLYCVSIFASDKPSYFKINNKSSFDAEISYTSNQLYEIENQVPGNNYNFGAELGYTSTKGTFDKKFDAQFVVNDNSAFLFSIKNAYVEDQLTAKSKITFGRKPLDWSFVDSHWGFGFLNNRQNIDFFTPGVEGLTGITWERKFTENITCSMFGSILYLPELNPGLSINDDGTISAASPWATPPNSTAEISDGVIYQVRYDVDMTGIPGTVFKPSVGANCGYQFTKQFSTNVFAINKPEGKINTGVEISLKGGFVNAAVTPQAFYQTVVGGSFDYDNAGMNVYASVLSVIPEEFPDGDNIVTQYLDIATEKYSESYFGSGISKKWDYLELGLHYVARISEYIREDNLLSVDPRWHQAVNFTASYAFTDYFNARTDLKYDALTHDRLLMASVDYLLWNTHSLTLGVNIIGSGDADNEFDTVGSYWSRFRNNDSIYARYGLRF